ncbi:DUF4259 domain-containing protein [Rhodococcus sp. AD45-ID]|uniref:DUF4259 domain-containing protein n=1 Tax=unclassified Rhodococcus (in: high G+C Gram-positive bacteria) TaxID=192944 RepID=UPI0005D44D0F|nr:MULTISPECIES: DUF4259 domain-containing protein [unclassified Rhodococcus (in: high G+C Gram-positive bacteria)]KJF25165.1 hypothetical protein SZ00_02092 [Rhodococcus sp. AD45]PSR43353.1 DUF4259 domain-containing protein [Rhodococcus sp. AD45-ID]RZL26779.1 MAG: DUF4259 domain-containing protein [Rhodococcus sp. (in: high G+C Gram-positive bacteria)]
MGAWGSGPFENDGAGDLIASIGHGDFTFESAEWAFEDDYLEVDGGQIAVALLELVLIVRADRKRDPAVEELALDAFADALTSERLTWLIEMVERTIASTDSELFELWDEQGPEELAAWRIPVVDGLEDLRVLSV